MNTLQQLLAEPGAGERSAFAKLAGEIRPGSIALAFTPAQLKLIADALLIAEVHFTSRSEWFGKIAATTSSKEKRIKSINLADQIFCKGCDARDLSEKISAEIRRARP
jgi:hypothetical protein